MKAKMKRGVALVTGAGAKRVGNFIALKLAEEGYDIAVHYRNSEKEAKDTVKELRSKKVRAEMYNAELTNDEEVRNLVDSVVRDFGRIDVLVHAAAAYKRIPLKVSRGDDVRKFFEINSVAPWVLSKEVGLVMKKQKEGGNIILFSDWAIERPYKDYSAYFPSKGAIPTIVKVFANELASLNPKIRINGIAPGPVLLPKGMPKKEKQAAINATLVKHEGNPENIFLAVKHFIENDFVTGQILNVDGGRSVYNSEDE